MCFLYPPCFCHLNQQKRKRKRKGKKIKKSADSIMYANFLFTNWAVELPDFFSFHILKWNNEKKRKNKTKELVILHELHYPTIHRKQIIFRINRALLNLFPLVSWSTVFKSRILYLVRPRFLTQKMTCTSHPSDKLTIEHGFYLTALIFRNASKGKYCASKNKIGA